MDFTPTLLTFAEFTECAAQVGLKAVIHNGDLKVIDKDNNILIVERVSDGE